MRRIYIFILLIQFLAITFIYQQIIYKVEESNDVLGGEVNWDEYGSSSVIHPYLGFVLDRDRVNNVNALGFHGNLIHERKDGEVVVGIFGGSLANLLYLNNELKLQKAIAGSLDVDVDLVKIYSFALGGYKQPQQLLTLSYLLSLGYEFDYVINIDGYNEIVLSLVENNKSKIAPFFPRQWNIYSQKTFSPDSIKSAYKIQKYSDNVQFIDNAFSSRLLSKLDGLRALLLRWNVTKIENLSKEVTYFESEENQSYKKTGPLLSGWSDNTSKAIDLWSRSSILMNQLARSNNIVYLHFLQPNQYVEGSKQFSNTEDEVLDVESEAAKIIQSTYPQLSEVGSEFLSTEVAFFDLSNLFLDIEDTVYVDACCHVNELGNSILISRISEEIRNTE